MTGPEDPGSAGMPSAHGDDTRPHNDAAAVSPSIDWQARFQALHGAVAQLRAGVAANQFVPAWIKDPLLVYVDKLLAGADAGGAAHPDYQDGIAKELEATKRALQAAEARLAASTPAAGAAPDPSKCNHPAVTCDVCGLTLTQSKDQAR